MMNKNALPPDTWIPAIPGMPLLADVIRWEPLRQWGLSEVWRITMRDGESWIAKRSIGSMLGELDIYYDVLAPLLVRRPALHAVHRSTRENFWIMEDLGCYTLEMQPQAHYFLEAARVLACFRCVAAQRIEQLEVTLPEKYSTDANYFLLKLEYLLQQDVLTESDKRQLAHIAVWLPDQLTRLYKHLPVTLCHNDYHVKNLVIHGDTVVPIDWAMAVLNPFLGDLFILLRGAGFRKVEKRLVLAAYEEEVRRHAVTNVAARQMQSQPLSWQIALGGVCILILSIDWIVREARFELPESAQWIPRMLQSMEKCSQDVWRT